MSSAIPYYLQLKQLARAHNHRQLCCLQGTQSWCFEQSLAIIKHQASPFHWCGDSPVGITSTLSSALLGQEINLLILNMHASFDANMFAAAEGSVCGGCVIILLLPEKLAPNDNFSLYMQQQIKLHQFLIFTQNMPAELNLHLPSKPYVRPTLHLSEQKQAISAILKTVTGHRRRPLVLTANRGRGKSAALGIAAATLINQGRHTILVCAPNKQATKTLYKHAALTLADTNQLSQIQFISPDALVDSLPACDLLIIDEAAAIPIKLLTIFAKHYSRLVFASTQFGYEGSGRGFALRFQKQLNTISPQTRTFHLDQPIRWAVNDPVESFTLTSLCLIAPAQNLSPALLLPMKTIYCISANELLGQSYLLNQVFTLLVNAHYQTKPSDLKALLNDQNLSIIIQQQADQILAVALVSHEGGFDLATSCEIYEGKRRPTGHLIAQSLTFHSGFIQAATHKYARIQRIAVQPTLQNNLIGTLLIRWIKNWAIEMKFDHLSASFAGSDELLKFWQREKFQVLRIGTRKDKSSGQYSLMVNHPLNIQAQQLHQEVLHSFNQQVKVQFSRQLNQLDSSLIAILWPQLLTPTALKPLQTALSAYTEANRGYENIEFLLIDLLYAVPLTTLSAQQQCYVIEKIIQNHSWQEVAQQHKLNGQKQAQVFLKKCICDLLTPPLLNDNRDRKNETR